MVEDFYQHIKLYSDVSALNLSTAVSLLHICIRGLVAEDCCPYNKLYSNVKKLSKDLNQKGLTDIQTGLKF